MKISVTLGRGRLWPNNARGQFWSKTAPGQKCPKSLFLCFLYYFQHFLYFFYIFLYFFIFYNEFLLTPIWGLGGRWVTFGPKAPHPSTRETARKHFSMWLVVCWSPCAWFACKKKSQTGHGGQPDIIFEFEWWIGAHINETLL